MDGTQSNELKVLSSDKKSLEKLLECPICFEICIPPVYSCTSGHHICENCYNNEDLKKICGICSGVFNGTRNFFLENYFEQQCSWSCIYSKDGCQQVLLGQNLKTHQQVCQFRPLKCLICMDKRCVPYSEYLNHLQTVHLLKTEECDDLDGEFKYILSYTELDLNPEKPLVPRNWYTRPVKYQGRTFLTMNWSVEKTFGSWICLFGNEEDAKNFRFQITIRSHSFNKKALRDESNMYSMTWEGPVFPIRILEEEVLKNGKCLMTPMSFIQNISTTDQVLFEWNDESESKEKDEGEDEDKDKNDEKSKNSEDDQLEVEVPFDEIVFPEDEDEDEDPTYTQPHLEDSDLSSNDSEYDSSEYDSEEEDEYLGGRILGWWEIQCKIMSIQK